MITFSLMSHRQNQMVHVIELDHCIRTTFESIRGDRWVFPPEVILIIRTFSRTSKMFQNWNHWILHNIKYSPHCTYISLIQFINNKFIRKWRHYQRIFSTTREKTFSYYSNVSVLIGTVLYVEFMFQNMRRNINLELVLELTWLEWHFRYIISDYVNKFYVTRRYIQSFRSCDLFFDQWNFVLLFFWRHVSNKWQK